MEINSVQEMITAIDQLSKNYTFELRFGEEKHVVHPSFLFRGHGDGAGMKLMPGIFREKENGGTKQSYSPFEYNILSDFISEASRYTKNIDDEDILAWLEVAQHFGVPTRLLDFTQNPLVALYFACAFSGDSDGAVWVLNETNYVNRYFGDDKYQLAANSKWLVDKILKDEIVRQDFMSHKSKDYIQYPWIYKPVYREERMTLQSSYFMIWGADKRPLEEMVGEHSTMEFEGHIINRREGTLCKITIPASSRERIMAQLDMYGVNEKFIYPGMDGVGRYVRRKALIQD